MKKKRLLEILADADPVFFLQLAEDSVRMIALTALQGHSLGNLVELRKGQDFFFLSLTNHSR